MEFIIRWLASLFEAFKLKNPAVATIILVIAAAVLHGLEKGQLWGVVSLPEWAVVALQWASTFVLAVTGSETFRYLSAQKQATARK